MLPTAQAIADLQAQVQTLTGEKATLTTTLADAQAQAQKNFADLTGVRTELTTATGTITQLRADILTLTGERDQAKADLKLEVDGFVAKSDARIEPEVLKRCAAAGIQPLKRDPKVTAQAGQAGATTMTLADFNQLTPVQRLEFSKAGGTFSDK